MKQKKKRKLKIALIVVGSLLIILVGGFYIYTLDYYRADKEALQVVETNSDTVVTKGNMTVFYPDVKKDSGIGLIFYPGGKVEASAYAPMLEKLSEQGITCVLVKMPFNLAVFNINAANKVFNEVPDIEEWYLCGHSLGGAMASSYVGNNSDNLKGLILLGAYPINESMLPTLAIYGSEDEGLDTSKLISVRNKLEIVGGNHAYFGNYGEQEGDGVASISREQQQEIAVEEIVLFINTTK